MGLSSSKQKSSTRTNSTATTTPQVPSWIQGPYRDFFNQVGTLANSNTSPTITPASALQQQAFNGASLLPTNGNAQVGQASSAIQGLLGYTPDDVTAGQLAETDLDPYMNPYTQSVIDAALADIERTRAGAISAGQGAATAAGAFGGSRHGVSDSLTNEAALRTMGSTSANLRNQGYQTAQQAALADIMNRLNADQFNVNSGMEGARFRLGAAGQLGELGLANDASTRANLGLLGDLGATQRDIAEENDPQNAQMLYLARLAALLSAGNPSLFTGQTQTGQSTSNSTTTSSPSAASMFGTGLQTLGGLFSFSDRRLKRDVVPLGADANGLPWYEYRYVWDAPDVRHVGVMADEAPAHAVIRHASGFLMVNYGAL